MALRTARGAAPPCSGAAAVAHDSVAEVASDARAGKSRKLRDAAGALVEHVPEAMLCGEVADDGATAGQTASAIACAAGAPSLGLWWPVGTYAGDHIM